MKTLALRRPGHLAFTLSLLVSLLAGCTTSSQAVEPTYRPSTTQTQFSEAHLDSLLAPIALYPDTVLSHVLIASTYPIEVVEADRWARNNSRYTGEDAVNAVEDKDWDPSVKALVAFPDILKRMSEDLEWTQAVGDAFLVNEERVMDSIQKLRQRAYSAGTLDKVEHVRVIREERTIVIEPSVERVVYVPAYDTRVVYGAWWWPDYPPVYWTYPSSYVFVSGFYWGPRVYLGPRFYFSGVHWHHRRVVVIDPHHHHRFYDNRSLVRYNQARHWHHNPVHRRGVAYYDNHTRQRFQSPRESYQDARQYRTSLRNEPRGGGQIAPHRVRDQRQDRAESFQQQLERRQAGPMGGNDARERIYGERASGNPRVEDVRQRMNERRDAANRQQAPETRTPRVAPTTPSENRLQPERRPTQESVRPSRPTSPDGQPTRRNMERPQTRPQSMERSQPRFQSSEHPARRSEPMPRGADRTSMRGERAR